MDSDDIIPPKELSFLFHGKKVSTKNALKIREIPKSDERQKWYILFLGGNHDIPTLYVHGGFSRCVDLRLESLQSLQGVLKNLPPMHEHNKIDGFPVTW